MNWDFKIDPLLGGDKSKKKVLNELDEYFTDVWNTKLESDFLFPKVTIDTENDQSSEFLTQNWYSNSESIKQNINRDKINSFLNLWEYSIDNSSTEELKPISKDKNSTESLTSISIENRINKKREDILSQKYTSQLINLVREEDFEFGYISRSERLIREQLEINQLATRNWLNELFVKNFKDEVILIGIMRAISRFEPEEIFPQGQTMAVAALSHKNNEIKELGIRAFEKWDSIDSIEILESLKLDTTWLQEYVEQVIDDLKN